MPVVHPPLHSVLLLFVVWLLLLARCQGALVRMGHRLVDTGLQDVGYEYILLDAGQ